MTHDNATCMPGAKPVGFVATEIKSCKFKKPHLDVSASFILAISIAAPAIPMRQRSVVELFVLWELGHSPSCKHSQRVSTAPVRGLRWTFGNR